MIKKYLVEDKLIDEHSNSLAGFTLYVSFSDLIAINLRFIKSYFSNNYRIFFTD